jgi:hypothetical protein
MFFCGQLGSVVCFKDWLEGPGVFDDIGAVVAGAVGALGCVHSLL